MPRLSDSELFDNLEAAIEKTVLERPPVVGEDERSSQLLRHWCLVVLGLSVSSCFVALSAALIFLLPGSTPRPYVSCPRLRPFRPGRDRDHRRCQVRQGLSSGLVPDRDDLEYRLASRGLVCCPYHG